MLIRVGDAVVAREEFVSRGCSVDLFSPDGDRLEGDCWSDPRDESCYSAEDLLGLGFVNSPRT